MTRFNLTALLLLVGSFLVLFSCNDPLQIGADLFEETDVRFTSIDTLTIEANTVQLDSTLAYQSPELVINQQPMGWIMDPIFGSHKASLITQLFPESSIMPKGFVDSVVLVIRYDTLAIYGNENAMFDFAVSIVDNKLNRLESYYTDSEIVPGTRYGSVNAIIPALSDSLDLVEITTSGDLDTNRVQSILRMHLDDDFGRFLFNIDSANYVNIDSFQNIIGGIIIEPTMISNGFVTLNTASNPSGNAVRNRVIVYYTNLSGEARQFDYSLGGATFSKHDHDYSSGTIDGFIDNPVASEDLVFLQGSGGPILSIKFPYAESLAPASSSLIINEAIIELTTELLPEDNRTLYPLPTQIFTSHYVNNSLTLTNDVTTAFQQFGELSLFGGVPIETSINGENQVIYRLNISEHLQRMIEGDVQEEIFIRLAQNSTGPNRVVFKGINDPDNPIRLKITYTEL